MTFTKPPIVYLGAIASVLLFQVSVTQLQAQETDKPANQQRHPDYPKVDKALVRLILAMEAGSVDEPARVSWRLHVPPSASDENKLPLVFFLHGAGRRGDDNVGPMDLAYSFWSEQAQAKHPCFVLAPQCRRGAMWTEKLVNAEASESPTPELAAALAILDQTIENYPVDPQRIYVVGQSMGGFGTWDVLYRRPTFFAAAIPICGGGDPTKAALFKDVPIWAWHGVNDQAVPVSFSRELIAALKAAGGEPRYSELENVGHGSWKPAFETPELYEWLFAQTRSKKTE